MLNELSELEYWKTPSQMSSYAHLHAFLYLHAQICIKISFLFITFKIRKKWARILKNTLTDEQLCSLICFFVFSCSEKYQNIYSFIWFKSEKKIELNELNELKCSKTPSQMSSYVHKHVSLYLHAQANMNTLLY